MARPDLSTPEGRARRRAREITAFFWHLGVYIVMTGFLWLVIGSERAIFWVAVSWGLAVAFHGLATLLSPRGLEERIYNDKLATERRHEAMFDEEERRKEMVR